MKQVEIDNLVLNLILIKSMLEPDYDWEAHWKDEDKPSFEELCKKVAEPLSNKKRKYYACGSFKLDDTPKALYRALFLFQPHDVTFDDMYKGGLFSRQSADERFVCSFELFKYELGVYCYAKHKEDVAGKGICVVGGHPGCDNRRQCISETGVLFFGVVKGLLNHVHDVYPGNNFEV
jgi:hypothetical protein